MGPPDRGLPGRPRWLRWWWCCRRPRGSDLTSVRRYHSALGTIEHLADADRSGHRQGGQPSGGGRAASGRRAPDPSVPPVPVRGRGEFPDPENPIVFDDARPHDRPVGRHPPPGVPLHRPDRAQRHALESMNRRPRRATTVMVVVIVVALVGVLALLGSRHPKSANRGHASASTSVSATSSTAVRATRVRAVTGRGTATRPRRPPPPSQPRSSPCPRPRRRPSIRSPPTPTG